MSEKKKKMGNVPLQNQKSGINGSSRHEEKESKYQSKKKKGQENVFTVHSE